jgi:DNA-binding NarL/FixJ family response regulator
METAIDHILVFDDDPEIRHLLKQYLEKNGYQVTGVAEGSGMWMSLERGRVDLGALAMRLLPRSLFSRLTLVLLTGFVMSGPMHGRDAGKRRGRVETVPRGTRWRVASSSRPSSTTAAGSGSSAGYRGSSSTGRRRCC